MKKLIHIWNQIFLHQYIFVLLVISAFCFAMSFFLPAIYMIGWILIGLLIVFVGYDAYQLWSIKSLIEVKRTTPKVFSLSDENGIEITVKNNSELDLKLLIIDEIPYQFQIRDFTINEFLEAESNKTIKYTLQPNERGVYNFGKINVFIKSPFSLLERKMEFNLETDIAVYPSYLQMKKHALMAFSNLRLSEGIKKMRRLGNNNEFDQIKPYNLGDDFRSINWKATSKRRELMVNHYEDEKAQQVYFALDTSRTMLMPFNGLSLLDYAINSTLSLSNISLKKYDKAGLISFSKAVHTTLKADNSRTQLKKINEYLYRQNHTEFEANYELLYSSARNFIKGRSLIFLYTNFESMYALERVLPLLKRLNKIHLLVVVFFKNTEIDKIVKGEPEMLSEVYEQTIAQNFIMQKEQMQRTLRKNGIQTILSTPEALSINSINKYLELKARGLI